MKLKSSGKFGSVPYFAYWQPVGRYFAVPAVAQVHDVMLLLAIVGDIVKVNPRTAAFTGAAPRIVTVITPAASCVAEAVYRPPAGASYRLAAGIAPWDI